VPPTIREDIDHDLTNFLLVLLNGLVLQKHGRRGWPHPRLLWLETTQEELLLRWGEETAAGIETDSYQELGVGAITGVATGQGTDVMRRSGKKKSVHLYFSLLAADRTLDLECDSQEQRDFLAAQFARIIGTPRLLQDGLVFLVTSGTWLPKHMRAEEGEGGEGEGADAGAGAVEDGDAESGADEDGAGGRGGPATRQYDPATPDVRTGFTAGRGAASGASPASAARRR
jgi:hypothetical protein